MRFICVSFLMFCFVGGRAQQPDSLALASDTGKPQISLSLKALNDIKAGNKKLKNLVIPVSCITYGFLATGNNALRRFDKSTRNEIIGDHPKFVTKVDNYLQYSPAAAVYALNALGVKGKNNFKDRTIIYALTTVITTAFVVPLKKITKIERPDGSSFSSFPSGHTATAFAAAEFLRMEYKEVSPWYGIAGYAAAATTGVLRLYNNRHWVSDVVAGAGFGVLSTRLAYWIYPAIKKKFSKNKPLNAIVMPFYQSGGAGLALVYNLGR
jgi:membrane-associated phospholipid phosphatase